MLHHFMARTGAVSWLCLDRVATYGRPCRGRVAGVSLHSRCRVATPLGHDTSLYRNPTPCRAPCRAVLHSCPAVSQRLHDRVVACLATQPSNQASACHDATDCIVTHSPTVRPPSCHDTNDCIVTHPWPGLPPVTIQRLYRDTLHQQGPARARCRSYRANCASFYGACSAVSWPSPGRIVAHPLRAHACYVTIQSTVS